MVHLGAFDAAELDFYLAHGATNVVWAEANPNYWELLDKRFADKPGQHLFKGAITDKDDEDVTFYRYNAPEASSVMLPGSDLGRWYPYHAVSDSVVVKTVTVDTLLRRLNIPFSSCSYFALDIQGAEMLALRGADTLLKDPGLRYIYMEVCEAEFYVGGAIRKDLEVLLDTYGFALADIDKNYHRDKVQFEAFYTRKT